MSIRSKVLARTFFSHDKHSGMYDHYHTRNSFTNALTREMAAKQANAVSPSVLSPKSGSPKLGRASGFNANNPGVTSKMSDWVDTARRTSYKSPLRSAYAMSFKTGPKRSMKELSPKQAQTTGQRSNGFTRNNEREPTGDMMVRVSTTSKTFRNPRNLPGANQVQPRSNVTKPKGAASGFSHNFSYVPKPPKTPEQPLLATMHPLQRASVHKANPVEYQLMGSRPDHYATSYRSIGGSYGVRAVDLELCFNVEPHTVPPRSSSRHKFIEWLVADLSNALGEPNTRFKVHGIVQGETTVMAQLTILPGLSETQKDATKLLKELQSMIDDTSSRIYQGSVTTHILGQNLKTSTFSPEKAIQKAEDDAIKVERKRGERQAPSRFGYGMSADPELRNTINTGAELLAREATIKGRAAGSLECRKKDPVHFRHLETGAKMFATQNRLFHSPPPTQTAKVRDHDYAFKAKSNTDYDNRSSMLRWGGFGQKESRINKAKQTAYTQNFHLETTGYRTGAEGPRKTLKGLVHKRTTHEGMYQRDPSYNRKVRSDGFAEVPDNVGTRDRYMSTYKRNKWQNARALAPSKVVKTRNDHCSAFQVCSSTNAPWAGSDNKNVFQRVHPSVKAINQYMDPIGATDPHAHKRR